ncbi:MAG: hypothetical protein ABI877_03760 [Gemmatimonadaceae bacterium]
MGAEIEVRNAIAVAAAGAVLIGYVRAGAAHVGQLTAPLTIGGAAPRRLEVKAVERLTSMEAGGAAVGLVFRNPPPLNDLRRALPPGTLLVLEDPAQNAAVEPGAR